MNDLIALGLTLAGSCALIGALGMWCRPVKFHQLGRFVDNDVARERYEARLEAGGYGRVRNVREVV